MTATWERRTPGFWHLGLTVSDIARSITFYRDRIGMELVRGLRESGSPAHDALLGNPGMRMDVCWLRDGDFFLQLLEYTAGAGNVLDVHHNNVGSPHLSFVVDDLDARYAALRAHRDVTVTSDVVDMGPARSFYVEDPDGVPVELCEWKVAGVG